MDNNLQMSTQDTDKTQVIDGLIGLTPVQEKGALMLASGASVTDTAKELGIDRTTIYLWFKKVAFKCYLNKVKKDIQTHLNGCLFEMNKLAITAIQDCLTSNNEAIRLKASMWVFDKITSYNVGSSDAREVIKEECTHTMWDDKDGKVFDEKEYLKRLSKEGFSKL